MTGHSETSPQARETAGRRDIDIIHHPGIVAADVDAVVRQYERLGFMFTPLSLVKISITPGEDPVLLGAGNRNAIFEHNFLEVVGITDRTAWDAFPRAKRGPFDLDPRLQSYQGLHILHFGTEDLERVRARLRASGVEVSEIATLRRNVETSDGPRMMEARTIYFGKDANPEALMQVAQHMTPHFVLQERYMKHANGARALTEVVVCSPNPQDLAEKYGRYAGQAPVRGDGFRMLDLGRSRILVVDADELGALIPGSTPPAMPSLAAFTVAVRDLDAVRGLLDANAISSTETADGRLAVSAKNGCGSAVLFEPANARRPVIS